MTSGGTADLVGWLAQVFAWFFCTGVMAGMGLAAVRLIRHPSKITKGGRAS